MVIVVGEHHLANDRIDSTDRKMGSKTDLKNVIFQYKIPKKYDQANHHL